MIIFSQEFHQSIEELIEIFFVNEYFGFEDDCQIYGEKIYDFVKTKINLPISKIAPENYRRFGKYFIKYKANNRTTWYIFFDQKEDKFLINHILNNHSRDFPELL